MFQKEHGCPLSLPWEENYIRVLLPGPLHLHPDQTLSCFLMPKAANCSEVLLCSLLLSHHLRLPWSESLFVHFLKR